MAWLEIHQTLWTNRKTLHLAGLLEIESEVAAAKMIQLWHWCIDNAESGDLSALPLYVVARAANWSGDPATFVSAAVEAGYVDRDGDSLKLHDWWNYAGKLIEKRRQDAERKRRERHANAAPTRVHRTSTGHHEDVSGNSTVQNTTEENGSGRGESEGGLHHPLTGPLSGPASDLVTEADEILDLLVKLGCVRSTQNLAAVRLVVQKLPAVAALEVALDHYRWQQPMDKKSRLKDQIHGWQKAMQRAYEGSKYQRTPTPPPSQGLKERPPPTGEEREILRRRAAAQEARAAALEARADARA